MSHVSDARKYARDVVAGKIVAGEPTRLACQRQLDDLARWKGKKGPYYFDNAAAERVCNFIELLPHIKGAWARRRETIKLEPWQKFILTTVFGWKRPDGMRRFRTAYTEVARKNAKSTLSSGVGLYMLTMDGEAGAEVYSAATTRDQARIVFADAKAMAERSPELRQAVDLNVNAHNLNVPTAASKFEALSAEGNSLDGLNIHCAVIDELHAHKDRRVFDVIETATGSREQPLLWLITTAGSNRAGVCYEQRLYLLKVLQGVVSDETYFGIIYALDDGDDWADSAVWGKANPNLNVSVYQDDMQRLCDKAMTMASAQNNFLTKRLDVWVNAKSAWMNMPVWESRGDTSLSIDQFEGEPCWMGLDLATKRDVAALIILFKRGKKYTVFGRYYLPEATVEENAGTHGHYAGWAREGLFTLTPGNVTDFDVVHDDILDLMQRFDVRDIAYDPHQASYLASTLLKAGAPMIEYRNVVLTMSEPMKTLEALVVSDQVLLEHDDNPVLSWMMSNVVASVDAKENIFPRKEQDADKIDGVVALIMALGVSMNADEPEESYTTAHGVMMLN